MSRFLDIGGMLARLLAFALRHWHLVLIAAFAISPAGPHLRISYEFYGSYASPYGHSNCLYLGSRGFVKPGVGYMYGCPFVAWIDTREIAR